ncbi:MULTISPECIES: hypothetical protein [unclassified Paenibacillus]|uniref:Uncharacterized protein n=1 Tax=Paenibacillus provencensis TaxID=441151 RepID=A0ABW3PP36_9BACL|nr:MULTISPECIES: hypothetical protein [unclassified Paenibacillus]MCM3127254.1 hypothetical protein [Paenibacillus sp. MER 78]
MSYLLLQGMLFFYYFISDEDLPPYRLRKASPRAAAISLIRSAPLEPRGASDSFTSTARPDSVP